MRYLKDRPQSMNRYPNGSEGKSFYYKYVNATAQEWENSFLITLVIEKIIISLCQKMKPASCGGQSWRY